MNKPQKLSILAGVIAILVMSIFPAWLVRDHHRVESIGYHSIATPLQKYKLAFTKKISDEYDMNSTQEQIERMSEDVETVINWQLLALQWAVVAIAVIGMVFITRTPKKQITISHHHSA